MTTFLICRPLQSTPVHGTTRLSVFSCLKCATRVHAFCFKGQIQIQIQNEGFCKFHLYIIYELNMFAKGFETYLVLHHNQPSITKYVHGSGTFEDPPSHMETFMLSHWQLLPSFCQHEYTGVVSCSALCRLLFLMLHLKLLSMSNWWLQFLRKHLHYQKEERALSIFS